MLNSPLEYSTSLQIGSVFFVSPNEIKVQLDTEAPDSVALNTSFPKPFPRINSYLLIPSEQGYIVGQVDWITVENSPFPKRKGMQDFGLIDLPFPLRKLSLSPLGSLRIKSSQENKKDDNNSDFLQENNYIFSRGVNIFPTVGDIVLLPTNEQLKAIVTSGENLQVKIGTSPLAGNADVMIDPDRLFGRHLAVLGNTGSGKSCSVAGVIRWSLKAAANNEKLLHDAKQCNARFIILDPNGEYMNTFNDMNPKKYAVTCSQDCQQLTIPLWFLNTMEWKAFTQATEKTQQPTLVQALRSVRSGALNTVSVNPSHEMRQYLRTLCSIVKVEKEKGSPWGNFPKDKNFCERLKKIETDLENDSSYSENEIIVLDDLRQYISQLLAARSAQHAHLQFTRNEIDTLLEKLNNAHAAFGGTTNDILPLDADIPKPFTGEAFLRSLEANAELLNVSEHVETMLMRVRTLLSDVKLRSVICDSVDISLENWLKEYMGNEQQAQITVIDLSILPAEIVAIVTALISRMIFESLQRYRRLKIEHKVLPTVLVMEEAHTFIKRYNPDDENVNASMLCCKVFEKIAREGRKFGLGLVLSSQRPSELSSTVLSQCNTFLLHRISNDRDQEMIHRLLPDNLQGVLRDLPVLPARNAILLGWAAELPVLVQMNNLPKEQQPQSQDPDFWDVWTRNKEREVNWKIIADDWQGKANLTSEQPSGCQESTNSTEDFLFN